MNTTRATGSTRSLSRSCRTLTLACAWCAALMLAPLAANAARGSGPVLDQLATNHILSMRADLADSLAPLPGPGVPWADLIGNHDGALWDFLANPASGWRGDGTLASPYRLEFDGEDPLVPNRVTIPAASVPELQTLGPVTAAMWFKTSFDAPLGRYEYLLEWVEPPVPEGGAEGEGHGMSIAVQDGRLQVYQNAWVDGGTLAPHTWYHVVVVKDTDDLRIYLNGVRTYTGDHPHMGTQQSEITLGASTFRVFEGYTGSAIYGDFFSGAIAQVDLWSRTLDDAEVDTLYDADRALYPTEPSLPTPVRVASFRADSASGTAPFPIPGVGSPWVDLQGTPTNADLIGFAGDEFSGWDGDGSVIDPYCLRFDGVDDVASVAAGSVSELQNADALSAELWFQSGPEVISENYRYVLEWLQGFGATPGMSIAIAGGNLLVYLGNPLWSDVAPVESSVWYHLIVTKQPGEMRAYLNGVRVYDHEQPDFGNPTTQIVLGGSTWRGPASYGDFHDGAIAELHLWLGALDDAGAMAAYTAAESRFPYALRVQIAGNGTVGRTPGGPGYAHGATVQLTAAPDPGYMFSGWGGDASGNANPLDLVMNGNRTVTATFSPDLNAAFDRPVPSVSITALGPNPVRGALRIQYELAVGGTMRLGLYDLQGRERVRLAGGTRTAGRYESRWDGRIGETVAPPGVYFLRLSTDRDEVVRRVVLAR